MARTDTLGHFLTDVADAIRTKTGESGTIQASSFDTAIENIPSGGGKFAPKYICFAYYTGEDLSDVTAQIDTSGIDNMNYMFASCTYLDTLDLTGWDITNCSNLQSMFAGDNYLKTLDLSSFANGKGPNISYMFNYCTRLTHIDMRNFDFTKITQSSKRTNCFGATASNGVPNDCEIIVKDQTQKDYINTNFSRLTNVKTVAEYEAE